MPHFTLEKIAKQSPHLDWIKSNAVLVVNHGSRCYGTHVETSDYDFKGVCIPPKEYFFGTHKFEQAELKDPDTVIFDLRKFFNLASQCNPNVLEVLYVDSSDHIFVDDIGREILDNRDLFLSRRVNFTFSGYAKSQMRRITSHYHWLTNPVEAPPTRAQFGLPERTVIPKDQLEAAQSQIRKQLDQWTTDFLVNLDPDERIAVQNKMEEMLAEIKVFSEQKFQAAARSLGYDDNFIYLLDLERRYQGKMKEWQQYQEWKINRNPERAALEAKYGMDCKHAYHLVRLMRMCREMLTTGKVIVKRPDREELLAIRNGAWSYEQLTEWVEKEDKALDEIYRTSNILPHSCDHKKIEVLSIKLIEKSLSKYSWYNIKKYWNIKNA